MIPDLVPRSLLVEANAAYLLLLRLAGQLVGPAVGGILVATVGPGAAFLCDSATFAASVAAALLIRRCRSAPPDAARASAWRDARDGLRYFREQQWLYVTFATNAMVVLLTSGPTLVLVPFIVKNELGGSASDLGLVYTAGGIVARVGLTRRPMTLIYGAWAGTLLCLAVYGVCTATWQLAIAVFVSNDLNAVGSVVWLALIHGTVPRGLMSRVISVNSMVLGMAPLSFVLVAPLAETLGARVTLTATAATGAVVVATCALRVIGRKEQALVRGADAEAALG